MKIHMLPQTVISDIIAELLDRGTSRAELAETLGVKRPMISIYLAGDAFPEDEKLQILCRLHGKYNAKQIIAHKWLCWIMREKRLSENDLEKALLTAA